MRLGGFLKSSALSLASIVVSLVILEVGLRLANNVPVFAPTNFVVQALDLIRANTGVMVHDAEIGWRLVDNLDVRTAGMTTGSYGLRMNGGARRDPPQHAILAVGDSFTAGSGLKDDQSWPAQLEQLIGKPVLNAGAGAYGVDQMVLRAEILTPILHPDTIIVGILSQDILRNNFEIYGGGYKPWFTVENGEAVLHGVPVPRVDSKPMPLGFWRSVFGHSYLVYWTVQRLGYLEWWANNARRYKQVAPDKAGVDVSCALMDRLASLRDKYGTSIIVVFFWGAGEVRQSPPAWFVTPVVACAKQRNFGVLDLYDPLRKIDAEDPARFTRLWLDEGGVLGHPSAEGDAMTAQLLQEMYFR